MSSPLRVIATSINFGKTDPKPLTVLKDAGLEPFVVSPTRPLTEDEILEHLSQGYDALIAGLEPLTARVMDAAPNLKLIARVGIGFNNVDLLAARERGIAVTYTPDGPTLPVTEMTVGMMICTLRLLTKADKAIRRGEWNMYVGRRLGESIVGLIGVGRIGKNVARALRYGFPGCKILATEIDPDEAFGREIGLEWVDQDTLFERCDVVSVHVPLTRANTDLVTAKHIERMKPGSVIIDTSRGKIVNEDALVNALRSGRLGGVAKDVFSNEPYVGPLTEFDNVLLTSHLGGSSIDGRINLEAGAAREVANLAQGNPYSNPVPDVEYRRAEEERNGE